MKLASFDLANKTVLEVGCGRGDTTRELLRQLSVHPGSSLIAVDISDRFFPRLQAEFEGQPVKFLCTDACALEGIESGSIDLLVCNYTLCAINSRTGLALLALTRFWQVLKEGGWLSIEEEFPIEMASSPGQQIWAEKWRILKAASLIAREQPYTEFAPSVLVEHCVRAGFEQVQWEPDTSQFPDCSCLDLFQARLERYMASFPNPALNDGFEQWASQLRLEAGQAGGMEIPYYRLAAQKPIRGGAL